MVCLPGVFSELLLPAQCSFQDPFLSSPPGVRVPHVSSHTRVPQVQVPAVSTVGTHCLPVSFRLSLLPGQGRTERVFTWLGCTWENESSCPREALPIALAGIVPVGVLVVGRTVRGFPLKFLILDRDLADLRLLSRNQPAPVLCTARELTTIFTLKSFQKEDFCDM